MGAPLTDNTFHLKLHQIDSVPMVNTMCQKALNITSAKSLPSYNQQ